MHVYTWPPLSTAPHIHELMPPPPQALLRSVTEMDSCSTIVYSRDAGLYHGWDIRQH